MKNYIIGSIKKVIYESSTSPYKVGIFKVKETNIEELNDYVDKIISFTGSFSELNYTLEYTFYGEIVNHPKYGTQFNVNNYEIREPGDLDSLVLYLSSGMFKGIGLKTAKKIVEKFGSDTVKVIKETPEDLTKVHGMSYDKSMMMHDKILDSELNQDYIIKLNAFGFSVKEAIDLISIFKSRLFNLIDNNIYDLVEYIPFNKLDSIFLKNNNEDSSVRIEALFLHSIYELCYEQGDTLISREALLIKMKSCFKGIFSLDTFELYINKLINNKTIVDVNGMITLYDYYKTELLILDNIKRLNSIKEIKNNNKVIKLLDEFENRNNIKFDSDQKEAILGSINNNFYIISGGPGTGKTTIIKAIVEILQDLNIYKDYDFALIAPTGRSAKRMAESVIMGASTIHKYLKWNKESNSFLINEDNKSKEKIIIIDESSMIDIFLFSSLLKGLRPNVKIILVGDANQLPSIGPGDLLNNLLENNDVKKKYLNRIYRVKEGSYITTLANEIKNCKVFTSFDNYDDFRFIEASDGEILQYLKSICEHASKKGLKADEFQVLIPMYKGYNGIDNVNNMMSEIFNPNKKAYAINDKYYHVGDKVIQLVNDVDNNVFNGDIGYIISIEYISKKLTITIDFMGNIVEYVSSEFDKFTLAYAITIHKSQGSEYDNVVVVLAKSFSRMFYNKLIYTAITRAKKSLIVIGSIESFNSSVSTPYASNRETYLKCINKEK